MAAIDQYLSQANANQQQYRQQGDQLQDYYRRRADSYYNPLEEEYRQRADRAYGDLEGTPGYTESEAGDIMGDPSAAFRYYNPDELTRTADQGYGDVYNAARGYQMGLGDSASRIDARLGGAAQGIRNDLYGVADEYGRGVRGAVDESAESLTRPTGDQLDWQGGVYNYLRGENEGAGSDYGKALDAATDRDRLGLSSDFSSRYELSPQDEQAFKDVAAQATAGQYGKMAAEAKLRAAAGGNTSPAALAAIESNLEHEGAAAAGDAATRAALAASAEKANRVRDVEGMRLGSEQDIASRQAANAGNLYQARAGAAQNLAGLEQQGIQSATGNRLNSASRLADLRYNAANAGGQAKLGAASGAAGYGYNAAEGAANADMAYADKGGTALMGATQYGATTRNNVANDNQKTGQTLASSADAARSNRAAGVANQRIAGQNTYRGYLAGQQGTQQQGGANAASGAVNAYGTEGGLQNQATGQGMQGAAAKDNKPGVFDKILGAAGGILSGIGSFGRYRTT